MMQTLLLQSIERGCPHVFYFILASGLSGFLPRIRIKSDLGISDFTVEGKGVFYCIRWSCSADDLSHFSSLLSICLTLAKMDQKLLLLVAASSIRLTHCNSTVPSTHVETWYKEDSDDAIERFGFNSLSCSIVRNVILSLIIMFSSNMFLMNLQG